MIFSDLYYSANIVRVIKPRIDGWSVQRVWGRGEEYSGFWWET